MSEQAQQDRKKAVLTTLTGLVRASPLADRIDPKAFFMTLNANYPVLCAGNTMDLALLWGPLSQSHGPDALAGLFLKFTEAGERLGFEVRLPPELATLSPSDRQALASAFDQKLARARSPVPTQSSAQSPQPAPRSQPQPPAKLVELSKKPSMPPGEPYAPDMSVLSADLADSGLVIAHAEPMSTDAGEDLGLEPIPLPLGALTPLPDIATEYEPTPMSAQVLAEIKDEDQRRIISTLIGAVKSTEAGAAISAPQLSYFIGSRFRTLFDGQHFFFAPVYEALSELEGVTEEHIYQAAARFRKWLARIGVQLVEPAWTLPPEKREMLEKQASTLPVETYGQTSPRPSEQPEAPKPRESFTSPTDTKQEARLRKWGLLGFGKRSSVLRVTLAAMVAVGVIVALELMDPVRGADFEEEGAVFPLSSAVMVEGKWMGILDEQAWLRMRASDRSTAVKRLGEVLKTKQRLVGARVLHPKTSAILAFDLKKTGDFVASEALMKLGEKTAPTPKPSAAPPAPSASPPH